MSTTTTRRPLAEALTEAEEFRRLFDGTCERWEVAGSIRRRKADVGDCEHVVIPKIGEVPGAGLFAEPERVNLLWHRCDELLAGGTIAKRVYAVNYADGTAGTRTMWGDTYRGINFRGHLHEIFAADMDNFGCILAIRTGPGDFSKQMVMRLHGTQLRQIGGHLRYARDGKVYPCRTEEAFFQACGVPFIRPEDRR